MNADKPQGDLFAGFEVTIKHAGGYDPRKGRSHPDNQDPTLPPGKRPSLEQRYEAFAKDNPHVFAELLRLATARIDRGETFISIKALWEELRTSLDVADDGGGPGAYKLNNDYTALYARALIKAQPRLAGVIKVRARKGE